MRLLTLAFVLTASIASAQSSAPLVQPSNLRYLGAVTFPNADGSGRAGELDDLIYGGFGFGLGPDGQSLYYGCHDWHSQLARVTIPAIGGVGTIAERCTPVPNLNAVDGTDGGARSIGGSLWWNNRLLVSGYAQYDGSGNAVASHFAGPSIGGLAGPVRLAGVQPGMVAGYMGVVPPEWRALLGGPALTGQCCISIISRTSYGPAVSVFNPDQVGVVAPVPSKQLLGYDGAHPLAPLSGAGSQNLLFNATTRIGGVAFPAGTRSVLFVGRHGTGPVCYGIGILDPKLHGVKRSDGAIGCYDPVFDSNGFHAYPYQTQVWAYDANDLASVAAGTKQPWELRPYATWALPEIPVGSGNSPLGRAAYDPATRRLYVTGAAGSVTPKAHVYSIDLAPPTIPDPPACVPVPFGVTVDQAPTAANGYVRRIVLEGKGCP